jgi:TPP-dependent pyruvate/acetoin dehydrogenase alpha subunit
MYERMALIRAFEEHVGGLYRANQIPGFIHTSIGQEAVAVGVTTALRSNDYISTTHRGHGHVLAKGADVNGAMAELFGRATGLCSGKGGSMHIADPKCGILGANAIVGASIPIAVGAALTSKVMGEGRVSVAFFGDGAVNQGIFHEALNLASLWRLPVLFVCENNGYAEFTASTSGSRRTSLEPFGPAYGLTMRSVDGNDVEAVFGVAAEFADGCRRGEGPYLLEAVTKRWHGHYEGDAQKYRPTSEIDLLRSEDPLERARARMVKAGLKSVAELDVVVNSARERVLAAERFARDSPFPAAEEAFTHVFAD